MESIKEYLLQIVAVCMIAAICDSIIKNPMIVKVIRLISGILILLVVVAPLSKIDLTALPELFGEQPQFEVDTEEFQAKYQQQVQKATEEHIELIASKYGTNIQAKVTVSDDEIPIPNGIEIIGTPTSDQVVKLSDYIEQQLGIPKNRQKWRRND